MRIQRALTFDDVFLVPNYSELNSRNDVTLNTYIEPNRLDIPILSSPMDTVTEESMALFMDSYGGMGIIHRYLPIDKQVDMVSFVKKEGSFGRVGAAVGVNGDSLERTQALVDAGVDLVVMDVAHGHTRAALDRIELIKKTFPELSVMSANICTRTAARDCIRAGATALRVGVGGGSACTTRIVAGVGVPQVTAIMEIRNMIDEINPNVALIADGGMKNSGHIVKALAAGADAVMLGGMLAPYLVSAAPQVMYDTGKESGLGNVIKGWINSEGESASKILTEGAPQINWGSEVVTKKLFRGMASDSALSGYKKGEAYIVEGEKTLLDIDYDFEKTFTSMLDGIRLGLSYLGCASISDLREFAEFVEVTNNGYREATPHGVV